MKLKGLIFDLDQTLIDSKDAHYASLSAALSKYGLTKRLKWLYGKTAEEILKYNFPELSEKEIKAITLLKKKYLSKYIYLVKVFPYARYVLKKLKERNLKLGLLTNNTRYELKILLEGVKLNFFDVTLGKEDGPPKPNPKAVEIALKKMKLSNNEVIFVGDSDADIQACKDANLKIAVNVRIHKPKYLKYASWVFRDLRTLLKITRKM